MSQSWFFGETNPYLSCFEDDFDYSRAEIVGEFFIARTTTTWLRRPINVHHILHLCRDRKLSVSRD